jgi:hypothetical protein
MLIARMTVVLYPALRRFDFQRSLHTSDSVARSVAGVWIGLERLENSDMLRLPEPRSGGSVKMRPLVFSTARFR